MLLVILPFLLLLMFCLDAILCFVFVVDLMLLRVLFEIFLSPILWKFRIERVVDTVVGIMSAGPGSVVVVVSWMLGLDMLLLQYL